MPRRRALIALAGFLAVSVLWVGFQHLRRSGEDPPRTAPVAVRPAAGPASRPVADAGGPVPSPSSGETVVAGAGPFGDEAGLPTGYAHSRAGARAAAVGWVSGLGPLLRLGPLAAGDAIRALVSDRMAEETVQSFRDERNRFVERFHGDPARAVWIESPLAVTVTGYDPDRATVTVWSQLVISNDSEAMAVMSFRTHTVTLVWEHDDWRVDGVTRVEGPTPAPSPGELPAAGWEFVEIAQWTPAVLAGTQQPGEDG